MWSAAGYIGMRGRVVTLRGKQHRHMLPLGTEFSSSLVEIEDIDSHVPCRIDFA